MKHDQKDKFVLKDVSILPFGYKDNQNYDIHIKGDGVDMPYLGVLVGHIIQDIDNMFSVYLKHDDDFLEHLGRRRNVEAALKFFAGKWELAKFKPDLSYVISS